jgi:hypothetical protein
MTTREATSPCCSGAKILLIDDRDCGAISSFTLPSAAQFLVDVTLAVGAR